MIREKKHHFSYLFLVILKRGTSISEINTLLLIIIFIIVLILIFLTLKYYNDKKRIGLLLNDQNTELESMTRKLSEGFGYAERIQTAILPAPDKVDEILNDYFIIFQPKQRVSGDFYWVEKRGKKKMFAVVDCTGHGIPGALMSIIGYDGLNRAIIDYELTRADKIVSALNEYMTETLKLTGSVDVKDAIDLAICVYNIDKSQIEYTGARNPLYIVRQTNNSLIVNNEKIKPVVSTGHTFLFEIKPDRKSVEPSAEAEDFTNNYISVEKGDTVYVFSDGLADQFGGEEEKKFGYKRLRETLVSIQDEKMKDQKKRLETTIHEWKGNNEQVDDITLIGVKI